jgi:ATP:ADP antiporter, AAA family
MERLQPSRSGLDRALSLFTDVRSGEGVTALLLAANIFCFLALYSILKPVRSALILSESGAVAQSYAAAAQALLLLVLVPLYGRLASHVDRVRLIAIVTTFFAANLGVFYVLGLSGVRIGVAFYIWIGIFNLMVPAQLWAFANDIYSDERGRRLFPLIGVGASLGAWLGAEAASAVFRSVGPYRLMLVAAGALFLTLLLTVAVHRREGARRSRRRQAVEVSGAPEAAPPEQTREPEAPLGRAGGFQLVLGQRYLLLIGLLMIVLNVVNSLGEFLLASFVEAEARSAVAASGGTIDAATWIGGFMARFQANVNLLGLLLQMFVVSRVLKYIGVRGALYILPFVALMSYGSLAFFPVLAIVVIAKTLENSADYSIQNTTRQALFLPTSREAKYKAKQAIDSFFHRSGDLLQALVVFAGTALALTTSHYAVLNLLFVGIWLVLVTGIAREHRKLTGGSDAAAPPPASEPVPAGRPAPVPQSV